MLRARAAVVGVTQSKLAKFVVAQTANLSIAKQQAGVVSPDSERDGDAFACVDGSKRLRHLFRVVSDVIPMP